MCDEGRFGFKYIHEERRLSAPRYSGASTSLKATSSGPKTGNGDGRPADLSFADPWPEVIRHARKRIAEEIKSDAQGFVAVFSPFMTVEEAYLLASYLKGIDSRVRLVLGPVPVIGSDDVYPKGPKGEPPAPGKEKFTIRAEKCPNRLGVESVLRHFEGQVIRLESLLKQPNVRCWYFVGGYPQGWVTESIDKAVGKPALLIVQDLFPSPLSERADILFASASFAERDGTYVNHAGLAQAAHAAIRPPAETRADGRILMELAERSGLFNAMALRKEIGLAIPELSVLAVGDLGDHGVRLARFSHPHAVAKS
jgi:NADH-quinone oxidoreductase subunit G